MSEPTPTDHKDALLIELQLISRRLDDTLGRYDNYKVHGDCEDIRRIVEQLRRPAQDASGGVLMGMPTVELGVDIKWIMAELDRAGVPQGHDSTDGLPSSPEGRVRWLVNNYLREHDQLQRLLGIEVVRSYLESP